MLSDEDMVRVQEAERVLWREQLDGSSVDPLLTESLRQRLATRVESRSPHREPLGAEFEFNGCKRTFRPRPRGDERPHREHTPRAGTSKP